MDNSSSVNRFNEPTISSRPIFTGKIITLQVDEVRLPDGQSGSREIVRHPGAVAVLALDRDRLIVVEQYRKALERAQVEIPAGKLEPGEDPIEAAKRELEEETGYTCGAIRLLHTFATSPGFADELIYLYVAEQLMQGESRPDEDEFIECEAISWDQAQQYITEGRICDAKTLLAIYAWQSYRLTGKF